jgi:HAD superfamily hydrolase (TIGR01490 family)
MPGMKSAAVFDFDGTICRGDSALPFALFVLSRRPAAWSGLPGLLLLLPGYGLGRVSKLRMKSALLRLTCGLGDEERRHLVEDFWRRHLEPRLFKAALERISWHRARGDLLILATASVDYYMEEARRRLGFDILLATRTRMEPAPAAVGENCYGGEKVNRLRQLECFPEIDWSASWAYSDHLSDEPLLRFCGNRLAVNPHRPLMKLARRENWPIAHWV